MYQCACTTIGGLDYYKQVYIQLQQLVPRVHSAKVIPASRWVTGKGGWGFRVFVPNANDTHTRAHTNTRYCGSKSSDNIITRTCCLAALPVTHY